MASTVYRDDDGKVTLVESDQKVLDPDSPEAVQVPEGVANADPFEVHDEPSSNDVSAPKKSSSKSEE